MANGRGPDGVLARRALAVRGPTWSARRRSCGPSQMRPLGEHPVGPSLSWPGAR